MTSMIKKFFLILLAVAFLLPAQNPQNDNFEMVTNRRDWIQDSRLVVPVSRHQSLPYILMQDFVDFIKSAYGTGIIQYDDAVDLYTVRTPHWTVKILYGEDRLIYNDSSYAIAYPLVLKEGAFYVSTDLVKKIASLSKDFSVEMTQENYVVREESLEVVAPIVPPETEGTTEPVLEVLPTEVVAESSYQQALPEQEIPTVRRIGFHLKTSLKKKDPKLVNQIQLFRKYLEDYSAGKFTVVFLPDEVNPILMAETANKENVDIFIQLHFTHTDKRIRQSMRVFYLSRDVHPYYLQDASIVLPYEYSTNFASHADRTEQLVSILHSSFSSSGIIQALPPASSLIIQNEYISAPSVYLEFYNLDLSEDISFFQQEKNIQDLVKVLLSGVRKFSEMKHE